MSKCTISFSQPSMAMVKIVMKKNRVIDIPQRSYMVLPRVVKKRKKEKKTWNGLLNVSNGHKHINHPGLLPKSRKTTLEAERRKVQMKKSNGSADAWMHTTGKLVSIIKRANRPALMQHTLTFCSLRLRSSLKGISVIIHQELWIHPGKGHPEEATVDMF